MSKIMETEKDKPKSFIMEFWFKIFSFLKRLSIFSLVLKLKKPESDIHKFVEKWVLGNLIGAFIATIIGYNLSNKFFPILWIILIYAVLRVFEIIIYQINVMFFDPYAKEKKGEDYRIKSSVRMVVLLLHNYIEVMFWYAAIVIILMNVFNQPSDSTWMGYLIGNIVSVATFDSSMLEKFIGEENPLNLKLYSVIFLQIITGLIMTLLSLARFMNLMPDVRTIDKD